MVYFISRPFCQNFWYIFIFYTENLFLDQKFIYDIILEIVNILIGDISAIDILKGSDDIIRIFSIFEARLDIAMQINQ